MTFESEGLYIVAFLHMVAAGELCCLSDNSGYENIYRWQLTRFTEKFRTKIFSITDLMEIKFFKCDSLCENSLALHLCW